MNHQTIFNINKVCYLLILNRIFCNPIDAIFRINTRNAVPFETPLVEFIGLRIQSNLFESRQICSD